MTTAEYLEWLARRSKLATVRPVEHHASFHPSESDVRVRFPLDEPELGESELLWGRKLTASAVRLDNVPLLVFGVSLGDVVRVDRMNESYYSFAGVVERGGHSTYRVMLSDPSDPGVRERLREVVILGCGYESLTPRFLALDVPPAVDVFRVYRLLEEGLDARAWTFEEGHCGHPVGQDSQHS